MHSLADQHPDVTVDDLLKELFLSDVSDDLSMTKRLKGRMTPGTCEWLLETPEYLDWFRGHSLRYLWLVGPPGSGKTVISCFLVEKLSEVLDPSEVTFAYYICDNKDTKRRTATSILRGILVQLLKQQPDLFHFVKDAYKMKQGTLATNFDGLWSLFAQLLQVYEGFTYILIDAIDECDELSRQGLLGMLADLPIAIKVRILITGRPDSGLDDVQPEGGICFRIDTFSISADLARFIDTRANEIVRGKKFSEQLIQDIKQTARSKAGGTFLWPVLFLEDIAMVRTSQAARKKLTSIPAGLPGMYDRILNDIRPEDKGDAVLVLQWVVAALRPMTVTELATAMLLNSGTWHEQTAPSDDKLDDWRDLYKSCSTLLYHDSQTDTINLIHQSVKDYLVSNDLSDSLREYQINLRDATIGILNTSWGYLSLSDFEQGAVLISESEGMAWLRWLPPSILQVHGFLSYATEELLFYPMKRKEQLFVVFISQLPSLDEFPLFRHHWLKQSVECNDTEVLVKLLDGLSLPITPQHMRQLLNTALLYGSNEAARILIKSMAVSPINNLHLGSFLHLAVSHGRKESIILLVNRGADINYRNKNGNTALSIALSFSEYEEIALLLLDLGSDPMILGHNGEKNKTMLFPAVMAGQIYASRRLLTCGIDVNGQSSTGKTALWYAVFTCQPQMIALLIEAGADMTWRDEGTGETLLHLAVTSQLPNSEALKALVSAATLDVNATSTRFHWPSPGWTPHDGQTDSLPNSQRPRRLPRHTWESTSALHIACIMGTQAVVQVLVEAGAQCTAETGNGETGLHLAALMGHVAIVEYLLHCGISTEHRSRDGWTPIFFAVMRGHTSIVELLLSNGADINATTPTGFTPLLELLASERSKQCDETPWWTENDLVKLENLAKMLIEKGSDINATVAKGFTGLHWAARAGRPAIVQLILELGANVNALNDDGNSALKLAMTQQNWTYQREKIVLLLLNNGASICASDGSGTLALVEAAISHSHKVVFWLLQHHVDPFFLCGPSCLNYPRADALREALTAWRTSRPATQETSSDDGEVTPQEHEILNLLSEMIVYSEASQGPSLRTWMAASTRGYTVVIPLLVQSLTSDPAAVGHMAEALFGACREGHEEVALMLLEAGADVEAVDSEGSTPLVEAISGERPGVVKLLLDRGAHVNRPDCHELTPLMHAVRMSDHKIVEMLLFYGADVNAYDLRGRTPLMHVARARCVSKKPTPSPYPQLALPDPQASHHNWNMNAESSSSSLDVNLQALKLAKILISHGANVNAVRRDWTSSPLLHYAILRGNRELVELLLSNGADVNAKNNYGNTPLCIAFDLKNLSLGLIVELLKWGADPKTTSTMGTTLLSLLVDSDATPTWHREDEVLGILRLAPACLDVGGGVEAQRLLRWATRRGFKRISDYLIERGVERFPPSNENSGGTWVTSGGDDETDGLISDDSSDDCQV